MMNIVYLISKYITVVGTVLKGFWEHLFCRILGLNVEDARYLQPTELCGHVDHSFTDKKGISFMFCYFPGFMNRLFGYGMTIGSFLGLFYLNATPEKIIFWVYVVMLYLGISLMCNVAPLYEDALNNWDLFYGRESNTNIFIKIIAFIPSALFIGLSWLEKYGINVLIYAIVVVILSII